MSGDVMDKKSTNCKGWQIMSMTSLALLAAPVPKAPAFCHITPLGF